MKLTALLNFALLLLSTGLAETGLVGEEYVRDEIIVKFSAAVGNSIEEQLRVGIPPNRLKLSKGLDRLNLSYRAKAVKPLLKDFRKRRQQLKLLQRKNETLLTRKEKHLLKRLGRASKDATVPNLGRIYKIKFDLAPGQSLAKVIESYQNDSDIEYAEFNYIVSTGVTPNDPLYNLQWSLDKISAPQAWDNRASSNSVIVAVIDTGVDYNHRDLSQNVWINRLELNGIEGVDDDGNGYVDDVYGYDFHGVDADPVDDNGHGTHCSGTIAAEGNNGLDIAGVSWDAKIMAIKFLDHEGYGNTENAVLAIYYAVENGADITSNSWGGGGRSQALADAINYAFSQGVVTVAAAGNDYSNVPTYPAANDHVIAVAATDSNDQKPPFSNYGDWVDIAAPGVGILSLRAGGTSLGSVLDEFTTFASGTSMACPHVAGACAFLLSINPALSNNDIYDVLTQSVDPISPGVCSSGGRVNLFNAARMMQGHLSLDRNYYSCSGQVVIRLLDFNIKSRGGQEVAITTNEGDLEWVVLAETDSSSGIFLGSIPITSANVSVADEMLEVSHGVVITATYYDQNDGTGNAGIVVETADVDCVPPEITNVQIDPLGPEPKVTFQTNEPTTAHVLFGAKRRRLGLSATDSVFEVGHVVELRPVSAYTEYFFIVEASDVAGNTAYDDMGGQSYTFTTDGPVEIRVPAGYATIQEAINHSWDTGTILVAEGTYSGHGNRDIDFEGKAILVKSETGPENCIVDCNGTGENPYRGFIFDSGEGASSILDGFTVTNGHADIGGAVFCIYSSPTIKNCIFENNSAGSYGGAVYNWQSSPTLTSCTFSNNWAGDDGGAMDNGPYSRGTLVNCAFNENRSRRGGAGSLPSMRAIWR